MKVLLSTALSLLLSISNSVNGQSGTVGESIAGKPGQLVRDSIDYPSFRYVPFSYLDDEKRTAAVDVLGFTELTWDRPGLSLRNEELDKSWMDGTTWSGIERKKWDSLLESQQEQASQKLSFTKSIWDCYINHYMGYSWAELMTLGIEYDYIELGYDEESWNGSKDKPDTMFKKWIELSTLQKKAAQNLCYFPEIWELEPLTLWISCFWNHRQQYWTNIPEERRMYWTTLGWTQPLWDGDDESKIDDLEKFDWDDLTFEQKESLQELCYTEELWNDKPRNLPPLPRYRYTSWDFISSDHKTSAQELDYTLSTWNKIDSADIEQLAWHNLDETKQGLVKELGFNKVIWDCYQNNYQDYSWDKVSELGIQQYLLKLGWTKDIWSATDGTDPPPSDAKMWVNLTANEQRAAYQLCFTKETWDEEDLSLWENCYWHHEHSSWRDIEKLNMDVYWSKLGWNKTLWDNAHGPDEILTLKWNKLSTVQKRAAEQVCYYEQTWDNVVSLYAVPTYEGIRFTPYDFIPTDHDTIIEAITTLGYTKETWDTPDNQMGIESKSYDQLTPEQAMAAEELGFADELMWDCWINHYYAYSWTELEEEGVQTYYSALGWTESLWDSNDVLDVPPSDALSWDMLSDEQKKAATNVCYTQALWDGHDMVYWNCWWNHDGEYWDELKHYELDSSLFWKELGWNESSWNGITGSPSTEYTVVWDELDSRKRSAAARLCYKQMSWDKIVDDRPPSPDIRYTPWFILQHIDSTYAQSAADLTYNQEEWDKPDVNDDKIEFNSFDDLNETQQQAAMELDMTEDIWDCYISNYISYDWDELAEAKVQKHYITLGWTEGTWEKSESPPSELKVWADLTSAEQKAAKQLCFRQETWDGIDFGSWKKCYWNHMDTDITWTNLQEYGVSDFYEMMGWTKETWEDGTKDTNPKSWSMSWKDLLYREMRAAEELCYFEESWALDDSKVDFMDQGTLPPTPSPTSTKKTLPPSTLPPTTKSSPALTPTISKPPPTPTEGVPAYPYMRFTPWDLLTEDLQEQAGILLYTEDTWNNPGKDGEDRSNIQYKDIYENLDISQQQAAEQFGFTEASWDCYQNHYYGYSWNELDEILGVQDDFIVLGWNETTWPSDTFKPASYHDYWGQLSEAEQTAAKAVCFFQEVWDELSFDYWNDCFWVNNGDTWSELATIGVQQNWQLLGWSETSWAGTTDAPATSSKAWTDLTASERMAAQELCYHEEIWNKSPKQLPTYPDVRYTIWHLLSDKDRVAAGVLNYTEMTWNTPDPYDKSKNEYKWFENLEDDQQIAAKTLGFTEESWDCYQNHYNDYSWQELAVEGLQSSFIALGWSESMWVTKDTVPSTENVLWDDLSSAQQKAATDICYFKETWNELELTYWNCYWNHDKVDWDDLSEIGVQQYWEQLGWTKETWVEGGDGAPESDNKSWDDLSGLHKRAAEKLCFYEDTWNSAPRILPQKPELRFQPWHQLDTAARDAAEKLNYTVDTWNRPDIDRTSSFNIEQKTFDQLSADQTSAAVVLGFTESSWDCWQNHYYEYSWDELDDEGVKKQYEILGWNSTMWVSDTQKPKSDSYRFTGLSVDERRAATDVCFFYEIWQEYDMTYWDCYWSQVGYLWEQLTPEAQMHWKKLGWNEKNWNGEADSPDTEFNSWKTLTLTQKIAIKQLCYSYEAWEDAPRNPPPYPEARFVPWALLDETELSAARILEYTEATWNNPDTSPIESSSFGKLTAEQKKAAMQFGFNEKSWDCYQNHYKDYTWDELTEKNVHRPLERLGWTSTKWDEIYDPPASWNKWWTNLTTSERKSAEELCFFQEDWDEKKIPDWDCFWGHDKDSWSDLEKRGLQKHWVYLGWDESSWTGETKAPRSDAKKWDSLTRSEKIAADKLCFYEKTWNTYKTNQKSRPTLNLSSAAPSSDSGKLSGGAIIGIILGVLMFLLICVLVVKKLRNSKDSKNSNLSKDTELFPNTHVDVI